MFVCLECGYVFGEDDVHTWKEDRGECFGFPSYETYNGCPNCGGSYTKTYQCNHCGEWIVDDYIKIGENRYCQNCYQTIELGNEI